MKKTLLACIIRSMCCLPSWGGAYFEERYICAIEKNIIQVSLTEGEANCFSYIAQVSTTINDLETDLIQANNYLQQGRDKVYRTQVADELRVRRDDLQDLKTQIIAAIDDYESELFLKVKSLVAGYLMPKRQQVIDKIITANELLIDLKEVGDTENYTFVVKQVEKLQQQLILYDRIRFATSFMELIPPLKLYIQGGGFELDSIEDKPVSTNIT